jgi:hypothetical protein
MRLNLFLSLISVSLLLSCGESSTEVTQVIESVNQEPEVPTPEPAKSAWNQTGVVDEFGDIIEGKSIISSNSTGKFSNSATADSDLTVKMQLVEGNIYALFYEYNREPQAHLPESEFINVKVKVEGGEVIKVKQFLYNHMMCDTEGELTALVKNQTSPLKVIVDLSTIDKYSNTTYQFEIDPSGLSELLN